MSADLIAEARSFGYNDNQLIGRLVAALETAETKLDALAQYSRADQWACGGNNQVRHIRAILEGKP
jgi:hypothetical protein